MSTLVSIVLYMGWLFAIVVFCSWVQQRVKPWVHSLCWAVWCTTWFAVDVFIVHDQFGSALNAAVASYWWRDFWKKKPPFNRKKVEQLVGAKTKALKQKLVDSMPVSKPVLVPVGA